MERRKKRRSYSERTSGRTDNIRELRPEDFSQNRVNRDYSFRSLASEEQRTEREPQRPPVQRTVAADARTRSKQAAKRRKRWVRIQTKPQKMVLQNNFVLQHHLCIFWLYYLDNDIYL